jgi:hypothetical protein
LRKGDEFRKPEVPNELIVVPQRIENSIFEREGKEGTELQQVKAGPARGIQTGECKGRAGSAKADCTGLIFKGRADGADGN